MSSNGRGTRVLARELAFYACVLLGTLQAGCHRSPAATENDSHPANPAEPESTHASPQPQAQLEVALLDATTSRAPAAARIVAIGDLHGDLKATKRAFKLAGAIDEKDAWVGGPMVVVQTGDVLDRGNDELALIAFLDHSEQAANKAGGHLYRLNGNHEVMNVQGDYRYVTEQGFKAYAGEPNTGRPDAAQLPAEQRGRGEAFLPGGRQARKLAQLPVAWIVGDTVFAHGGVLPSHLRYGLDQINTEVAAWMRGEAPLPAKLQGDHTPFWIRDYGEENVSDAVCAKLDLVLRTLKAARLVVGHTPQKSGITFGCGQHLARIDVGLSSYYGNNPTQVLEIAGSVMRVLRD
jgi:hypothetical protein